MKKGNNIRVEMIRVNGDLAPFIQVGYVDKDANEHTGVMIIDSGSDQSILSCDVAGQLAPLCKKEGETSNFSTISNNEVTMSKTQFSFAMGGKQFHEVFCVSATELPIRMLGKMPVIGIIGNIFMRKHRLAIDYRDYTLHTSTACEDITSISDCDFFFPMEKGMKDFALPIILLSHNEESILAIADTGATHNQIALPTIEGRGMDCQFLGEKDAIKGMGGSIETEEAILKFNLGSVTEDGGIEIPCQEQFKVSPNYFILPEEGQCDENGEQLPPVEALVGSPFMAKEKWVLDFGANIIYKCKPEYVWDGNIRVNIDKKNKKQEKGKINFYADASQLGMPFILITEGEFAGLVFLIDTGSNDNIIFGYTHKELKDKLVDIEGTSSLYGIDGKEIIASHTSGKFSFCGKEHEMVFLVREDDEAAMLLSKDMGFPITGIIGTKFMVEHGWMIDFTHQEIVIPNTDVSLQDCKKNAIFEVE